MKKALRILFWSFGGLCVLLVVAQLGAFAYGGRSLVTWATGQLWPWADYSDLKQAWRGDAKAQYKMGHAFYVFGMRGGDAWRDSQAYKWFSRAAKQNQPDAIWALGKMYCNGQYVHRDVARCAVLLRRSAALGNLTAVIDLGKMYLWGRHLPFEPRQALAVFDRAAAKSSGAALRAGGILYYAIGVPKDDTGALARYLLARKESGLARRLIKERWPQLSPETEAAARKIADRLRRQAKP